MLIPEVIAQLDVFERDLLRILMTVRQMRLDLREGLDKSEEDLLE